jgi:hypothetical protein
MVLAAKLRLCSPPDIKVYSQNIEQASINIVVFFSKKTIICMTNDKNICGLRA